MKLNNRGQALVTFVILIPIVFMVMAIIIDIGLMGYQKRKITNTIKSDIKCALNKDLNEKELKELIDEDIKYEKININIDEGVSIELKYKYNMIFSFVKKNELNIKYLGFKDGNQIRIEEG